jgi:glycosyltransferase involved in cell wall biosynthesis
MTGPDRRRVLHVLWRLSKGGGIPVVVRDVTTRMDPFRFDVHIATVRPAFTEDELDRLPDTLALHPLGFTGRLGPLDRLRLAGRLARLVRELRPDVIHVHSGTAGYSLPAALVHPKARRVLEVHDAPGNGRHGRSTEWLEGQLARRLRFVPLAHSTSVRAQVARFAGLPADRVELVPLGIDTGRFGTAPPDPAAWRLRNGIPASAEVVLYVARLVATKNASLFVDVAERVLARRDGGQTVFAVVGSGPEEQLLRARISRDGLDRVHLAGPSYGEDLVAAYAACDLFLSTSDYEGFGLAVVEAMAAGKPCVATAVGGVTDLVDPGRTGILAARGDAAALADGVLSLLDSPPDRDRMGRAGAERARCLFDISATAAGYEELYQRLTGGPAPAESPSVVVLKSPEFGPPGPGPRPYRIDHLAAAGVRLEWTDAHHRAPWTWRPVRAAVSRLERAGPPSVQTALAVPAIVRSDAVLAMFESEGNLLAWLRRPGVPALGRPALVLLSCWLAELLPGFSERRRRRYRGAYRHVDRLLFFSSNQAEIYQRHLGLPPERLSFVPFGVDEEQVRPSTADEGFVLAVGRDRGRDWPAFFEAVAATGLPARVLCRPSQIEGLTVPANVDVLGYVDRDVYLDLLSRCRLVVVSSRPLAYPTGQSVILEGMAAAKCVVATDIPSMADYLEPGTNALTVPVGDAATLAAVMAEAFEDAAARDRVGRGGRRAVEERFNARSMWEAVAAEVMAAVASRAATSSK